MVDVLQGILGASAVAGSDTFADELADAILNGSLDDGTLGQIEEAFAAEELRDLARGIGYLRSGNIADRTTFEADLRRLVKGYQASVQRALARRFETSEQASAGLRKLLRGGEPVPEVLLVTGAADVAFEASTTPPPRPAVSQNADLRVRNQYTGEKAFVQTIVDLDTEALRVVEDIFRENGLGNLADVISELRVGMEKGISFSELERISKSLMELARADVSQVRMTFPKVPNGGRGAPLFVVAGRRVGATSLRDDDDLLAGAEWRKAVLPEVLGQIGPISAVPVEKAFHVLSDSKTTVAIKVVALRVLGDHLRGLDTVDRFLTALEMVAGILGQPSTAPLLRETALTLLHQINRPPTDVLIPDFNLRNFFDGALKGEGPHVWMINAKSAPQADLKANLERIRRLKARVMPLLGLPCPKPSAGWESRWPAWYRVIPDLFGERRAYFVLNPEEVFLNREIYPWQRALALAYYSFRIHSEPNFPPSMAGLLKLIQTPGEDPLIKEMATHVYGNVILKEIDSIQFYRNGSLLAALWKIDRTIDQLSKVVGPSHPVVVRLKREVEHFRRALVPNVERRWRPGLHPRTWFRVSTRRVGAH